MLLGVLSYVPTCMFLYFFGLVVYFTGGFADPGEPVPVIELGRLLFMTVSLLVGVALAGYYATLPVVKPDERAQVAVFLLSMLPLALPWFWHTRVWPTRRQGRERAPGDR